MSKLAGFVCALALAAPSFAAAQTAPDTPPTDPVLVGGLTATQATALVIGGGAVIAIAVGNGSSSSSTTGTGN